MTNPTLRFGDLGEDVARLQKLLAVHADGHFGPVTRTAVLKLQRTTGLVQDGVVGPKTWAALDGVGIERLLKQTDLQQAADTLNLPVAVVMAVNAVESRGEGFLSSGRPVILFERHVMYRIIKADGMNAELVSKAIPSIVNTQRGGYVGGIQEHYRYAFARRIHRDAAVEATSWGLFQIMGFHWGLLGYDSAQAFADAMHEHEREQLGAFVRFIAGNPSMHNALARKDWTDFARRYNGPAYRDNMYDVRMARAYEQFAPMVPPQEG